MSTPSHSRVMVVDWNVDGWHTITDEQLDLLESSKPDVLLLQEVTPASMEDLRERGRSGAASLELLPPDHAKRDGVRPRFCCAALARDPAGIRAAGPVPDVLSPVGALTADVELETSSSAGRPSWPQVPGCQRDRPARAVIAAA